MNLVAQLFGRLRNHYESVNEYTFTEVVTGHKYQIQMFRNGQLIFSKHFIGIENFEVAEWNKRVMVDMLYVAIGVLQPIEETKDGIKLKVSNGN